MIDTYRIQRDFGLAAHYYQDNASLQKRIALALARRISIADKATSLRILDAGCGTGFMQQSLAALYPHIEAEITQCDIAYGMCKYVCDMQEGIHGIVNASVSDLPFENQSFNVVFSSMVLQWVEELYQTFSEFYRVVDKKGEIYISFVLDNSLTELDKATSYVTGKQHVHQFVSIEEILSHLHRLGINDYHMHVDRYIEYYPSVLDIMRHLKRIGARYKPNNTQLISNKNFIKEAEKIYKEYYYTKYGLPVTWNIMSVVIRK